jgi:hypothetical protein
MSHQADKIFQIGFVAASVYVEKHMSPLGERLLRSVVVQRSFIDEGEIRYSSTLGLAELPQAIRVLQLAQNYVEACEAEIERGG